MKFTLTQTIAAELARVEAAYLDPAFYAELGDLEKIGAPMILDRDDGDGVTRLRVRYHFTGDLPSAARAVLDPSRLTWVNDSVIHHRDHRMDFTIQPDHYGRRLRCSGVVQLRADGNTTVRDVSGEVKVSWPLVGGTVERALVSGLQEHLRDEVAVLERWAKAAGAGAGG
jgi:hypothetical protein